MKSIDELMIPVGKALSLIFSAESKIKVQEAIKNDAPEFLFKPDLSGMNTAYLRLSDLELFYNFSINAGGKIMESAKYEGKLERYTQALSKTARTIPKNMKTLSAKAFYKTKSSRKIEEETVIALTESEEQRFKKDQTKKYIVTNPTEDTTPLSILEYESLKNELQRTLVDRDGRIIERALPISSLRKDLHITNAQLVKYSDILGAIDYYGPTFGYSAQRVVNVLEKIVEEQRKETSPVSVSLINLSK